MESCLAISLTDTLRLDRDQVFGFWLDDDAFNDRLARSLRSALKSLSLLFRFNHLAHLVAEENLKLIVGGREIPLDVRPWVISLLVIDEFVKFSTAQSDLVEVSWASLPRFWFDGRAFDVLILWLSVFLL